MHLNLRDVETLNIHDIYVCITTETQVIADASFTFATIVEQALIVLFTLGYMASIALEGFFSLSHLYYSQPQFSSVVTVKFINTTNMPLSFKATLPIVFRTYCVASKR